MKCDPTVFISTNRGADDVTRSRRQIRKEQLYWIILVVSIKA